MSPSGSLLPGLTILLTVGVACTPSGSPGRTPRAGADSAAEAAQEAEPEAPPTSPDVVSESKPPEASPPPRPHAAVRPVYVPQPAGPYKVRIVDDGHRDLPRFSFGGRAYVMGTVGSRYSIVIANPTAGRVEVVLSIDGLDAMDGHPANYVEKRGYILPAYGDATIDGFRTSLDDVATFRFSSVADSYAGRLGHARDVGVIGVAFFPEAPPAAVWQSPVPAPTYEPPRTRASPSSAPAAPPADDLANDSYESSGALAGGGTTPSAQPSPKSASGAGQSNDVVTKAPTRRPGLGTEFGEARASRIGTTEFERANPTHPSQLVSIRYNDRAGLVAIGIAMPQPYCAVETDQRLRETADPFRQNHFAQPPP